MSPDPVTRTRLGQLSARPASHPRHPDTPGGRLTPQAGVADAGLSRCAQGGPCLHPQQAFRWPHAAWPPEQMQGWNAGMQRTAKTRCATDITKLSGEPARTAGLPWYRVGVVARHACWPPCRTPRFCQASTVPAAAAYHAVSRRSTQPWNQRRRRPRSRRRGDEPDLVVAREQQGQQSGRTQRPPAGDARVHVLQKVVAVPCSRPGSSSNFRTVPGPVYVRAGASAIGLCVLIYITLSVTDDNTPSHVR